MGSVVDFLFRYFHSRVPSDVGNLAITTRKPRNAISGLELSHRTDSDGANMDIASIFWGIIGGAATWLVTDFVTRPIGRGRALIEEVLIVTGMYANLPAERKEPPDSEPFGASGTQVILTLTDAQRTKMEKARDEIRHLGVRLEAFARTQPIADQYFRWRGRNLYRAGNALIGLSNILGTAGPSKQAQMRELARWLKVDHI
jgi:hypothetical protein